MSEVAARPERIHFFQLRDAAGRPAERDFVVPMLVTGGNATDVALARQLRPYRPRLTEHPGVYWYIEEGVGSGWLRVEEVQPHYVDSLHQLMLANDLGLAAGVEEPAPIDQSMPGPRTGNPYILIGWGAVVIALGAYSGVRALLDPPSDDAAFTTVSLVAGLVFAVLGVLLIVKGALRMRWWRAARAEAKRRETPLPEKLTGLGTP